MLLGKFQLIPLPVGNILHLLTESQVLGVLDVIVHGDSLSIVVNTGVGHISEVRWWLFLLNNSTSLDAFGHYFIVVQDFNLLGLLIYDRLYRESNLGVIDKRLLLFDLCVMHSHRSWLMITDMLFNILLNLNLLLGYFWYLFLLRVNRLFHIDWLFLSYFFKNILLHLFMKLLFHLSLQ